MAHDSKKVRHIPVAMADVVALVKSSVPTAMENTAPMAEAPAISPILRDRPSNPETVPRRLPGTSERAAVLLVAWKS